MAGQRGRAPPWSRPVPQLAGAEKHKTLSDSFCDWISKQLVVPPQEARRGSLLLAPPPFGEVGGDVTIPVVIIAIPPLRLLMRNHNEQAHEG